VEDAFRGRGADRDEGHLMSANEPFAKDERLGTNGGGARRGMTLTLDGCCWIILKNSSIGLGWTAEKFFPQKRKSPGAQRMGNLLWVPRPGSWKSERFGINQKGNRSGDSYPYASGMLSLEGREGVSSAEVGDGCDDGKGRSRPVTLGKGQSVRGTWRTLKRVVGGETSPLMVKRLECLTCLGNLWGAELEGIP